MSIPHPLIAKLFVKRIEIPALEGKIFKNLTFFFEEKRTKKTKKAGCSSIRLENLSSLNFILTHDI